MQGLVISAALLAGYFSLWGKRLWVGLLLLTPFIALAPIEAVFVAIYKHPLNHEILATIFESNPREARDYLGATLWPLLISCLAALTLAIATVVLAGRTPHGWQGRARNYILVSVLTIPCALFITLSFDSTGSLLTRTRNAWNQVLGYRMLLEDGYPFGLPLHLSEYYAGWHQMRDEAAKLSTFRFGAHVAASAGARQIYVLVVGESSNRDHWSLFGYNRLTTPQLQITPNVIPISNMVSPWNGSRKAIPVLLTRKPGIEQNDFFQEASIVRAFSEAGFGTYWLSNQLAVGQHDSPISVYAYEADTIRFFNFANWVDRGTYDEVLLDALKKTVDGSTRNLFIVLHTMGSHGRYEHRYPEEFDHFQPSIHDGNSSFTDERLLNAYDNSILYTDHILASIINVLRSTGAAAAMFYASDHGEDIPDEKCKLFGHGNNSRGNFFIPALFWYSDVYAKNFPERVSRLDENRSQPVSTENVFETLIDIGGLDFPGHNRTKSLASFEFSIHPRLVNSFGVVDIDQGYFTKPCKLVVPKEIPGHTEPKS